MKIVKIGRINGLGNKGPEKAPDFVVGELQKNWDVNCEEIEVDNGNQEQAERAIYENAVKKFKSGGAVFVGGDHSISYPVLKAFRKVYGDESFLIVFDAHTDCMPVMKEPTHEEWLKGVVEGGFKPENIVLIGVRKIEPEERDFLYEKGIKYFGCDCDFEAAADYVTEKARGKNVYVSIDVDVFEPAVAPGVNYAEPCGLTSREFFYLFKRILHVPELKGIDIVEVVPNLDEKYELRTIKLCAKILQEVLESAM